MPPDAALEVFASAHLTGALGRSDVEDDSFIFQYAKDTRDADAISLTMPVVRDQYISSGRMLPIFEMNLPEGALLERLRNLFAKAVPHLDDLELLAILGQSQIGRLRYARPGTTLTDVPAQSLKELLTYKGTEDLFIDLVRRYATYSGISGMQPKVLLRADTGSRARTTHRGATHIVKSFDPREFPELAANEFFCMTAARHAGIETSKIELSQNRRILVIERFDLRAEGTYLGVEDFCVLSGLRSHGRYEGSYEQLAERIKQFVSPTSRQRAKEQLFSMLALSCAVENGDAHLKNFSVVYEHAEGEVTLAPAYDMLSTTAYMPRDTLALTLVGSKEFPQRKRLMDFARRTGLSEAKSVALLQRTAEGVTAAIRDIRRYMKDRRDFEEAGGLLIKIFERGLKRSILV